MARGSRIAVHGDYDVDGVCSTAILVRALRALGRRSRPGRSRAASTTGTACPRATVERLAAGGVDLLVTVDCGITAVAEVAAARAAGMDVVVTDHHRPGPELPDCPVVHPGLGDYPCPELCAAGVALKLSEGLRAGAGRDPGGGRARTSTWPRSPPSATSCRCATRTAASCARAWPRSAGPASPACGRSWRWRRWIRPDVGEQALGFRLGPRINAAGRMQRAAAALELLLTEDEARAAEVARELDLLNRDRREAETRILFAAEGACAPQASAAAIVVAGEGWHPGVVGIVASRLVERWRRPCVVIALDGERRPRLRAAASPRTTFTPGWARAPST